MINFGQFFPEFALALLPPCPGPAGCHVDSRHLPPLEVLAQAFVPGRRQVPGIRRLRRQIKNVSQELAGNQGDQKIRKKLPNFSKNSPKSCKVKKGQNIYNKAQFES
jgi:hypothetical protein